jgi:hypothetical protein
MNAQDWNVTAYGVQSTSWYAVESYYEPAFHAPNRPASGPATRHGGFYIARSNALNIYGLYAGQHDGDGVRVAGMYYNQIDPYPIPASAPANGAGYIRIYGATIESTSAVGGAALDCIGAEGLVVDGLVVESKVDAIRAENRCDFATFNNLRLFGPNDATPSRWLRVTNSRVVSGRSVFPGYNTVNNYHVAAVDSLSRDISVAGMTLTGSVYRQPEIEWQAPGEPVWRTITSLWGVSSESQPPDWYQCGFGSNLVMNNNPANWPRCWYRPNGSQPWQECGY